jgi:hypothetical protein
LSCSPSFKLNFAEVIVNEFVAIPRLNDNIENPSCVFLGESILWSPSDFGIFSCEKFAVAPRINTVFVAIFNRLESFLVTLFCATLRLTIDSKARKKWHDQFFDGECLLDLGFGPTVTIAPWMRAWLRSAKLQIIANLFAKFRFLFVAVE